MLAAFERHPHARAVLGAALPPAGAPSHAYLFHGPAGAGKRAAARAFAAELLAEGARDPANARARVEHGVHPDLTWVTPSGAAELLVSDIREPVVAGATRTPFESTRRVFVIERADTMNDEAANRMLKTLEEPPPFAHLVLLTDRPGNVLPTIASRCQAVRFEAPGVGEIAGRLHGIAPETATACARLALGDAERAASLAFGAGPALRAAAEAYARACVRGDLAGAPWKAILDQGKVAGEQAVSDVEGRIDAEAEMLPARDAKRLRREGETVARRGERRARIAAIDHALQLAGLWLRDVAATVDGAGELVLHSDRRAEVAEDAERFTGPHALREAVGIVEEARTTFILNPNEELLLEAVASRVERVLATG